MFRKSKALILCACLCIGLLVSFESRAEDVVTYDTYETFYVDYARPAIGTNQGYITILMENSDTGLYKVSTLFWNCYASSGGNAATAYMILSLNDTGVGFSVGGIGETAYYNVIEITQGGSYIPHYSSSTTSFIYTVPDGWYIRGYEVAGNVGELSDDTSDMVSFVVNYNEDGTAVLIMDLISVVMSISSETTEMLDTLVEILNTEQSNNALLNTLTSYVKTIRTHVMEWHEEAVDFYDTSLAKLNKILAELEESNSWLEKIYDWLTNSNEEEQDIASTQANQSTSDAQASIEDKSAGFIDSVGNLVSSMSYTGTDCAWAFPALYLPEIPGVMSRTQLTSEMPIDFAYWVNQLPSGILLLVQSVCTIGLIGYCFKEFYGVIEYVLTMRGGGSSE